MADPLHNDDYGQFKPGVSSTGTDDNRGKTMAYQAPLHDPIRKGAMSLDRELPSEEAGFDRQLPEGGNHRLNRTAEQIGGALGRVVSQARRVPDSARHGLHLVRDRAQQVGGGAASQISSSASSLAGNAQQRARELLDVVEERGGIVLDKVDEIGHQLAERGNQLKNQIDDRTRELRVNARQRAQEARLQGERILRDYPLQTIGCVAGAAFILGVSLRIVRANHARRY
jgi:ElaB/YqjD/DUF883 family membrane-anchored ribosome-binding protein